MKTGIKTLAVLLLSAVLAASSISSPLHAEGYAAGERGKTAVSHADEAAGTVAVRQKMLEKFEGRTIEKADNGLLLYGGRKNAEAGKHAQDVMAYAEHGHDEQFAAHYAGVYINREDVLVVVLSCPDETCACRETVREKLGVEDVVFAKGYGTYKEAQETVHALSWSLIDYYNRRVAEGTASAQERELLKAEPTCEYDHTTNTVYVSFLVPEDADGQLLQHYTDLFRSCIARCDNVVYRTRTDSIEVADGAECPAVQE